MNNNQLTQKQQHFCQVYLETGNSTEAYRQSYNSSNMLSNTINRAAKEVQDNPKIQSYIASLRDAVEVKVTSAVAQRIVYDKAAAMAEAKEAMDVCERKGNGPGMVAAIQLRAKLNGLIVDRAEVKASIIDSLSDEDSLAVLNALTAISNARQPTLSDGGNRN